MRSIITIFSKSLFFLVANSFSSVNAQSLQLDTSAQRIYRFELKKESDEVFLTTYYNAFDMKDNTNPFEIIITETNRKIINIDGARDGITNTLKNLDSESELQLVRQKDENGERRRLYQFSSKTTTLLFLMHENKDTFTMIEAEFPNEELAKTAIPQWQTIFWNAKN